ncbi:hypothetical protein PFISCL1PPCAC_25340, partial [Pristionchus fissidentatus]
TGAPSSPSYVPGVLSSNSDVMTFMERVSNTIHAHIPKLIWPMMMGPYDEMFTQHFGEEFPKIFDILEKNSYFFVNAEPITDFPRLITHKVVDIGGISTWSNILNLRKKTVLLSFGSVAKSYLMPE